MMASGQKNSSEKTLVSDFQELCAYWRELFMATVNDDENCLVLVEFAEKLRQKWLDSANECAMLKTHVIALEKAGEKDRELISKHKLELTEARAQIASLRTRQRIAESERDKMEKQVGLVRDLLREEGLCFSGPDYQNKISLKAEEPSVQRKETRRYYKEDSGSTDLTDIDYDLTGESTQDEDMHREFARHSRKYSPRSREQRHKTRTIMNTGQIVCTSDEENAWKTPSSSSPDSKYEFDAVFGGRPVGNRAWKKNFRRSFSQPDVTPSRLLNDKQPHVTSSQVLMVTPSSGSSLLTWASSKDLSTRQHMFFSKKNLGLTLCDYCKKRIPFAEDAINCKDCHYLAHGKCRNLVPLPCVPISLVAPTKKGRQQGLRLADFSPSRCPMIPSLIIHCVLELERRGLAKEGLYRVSALNRSVQEVLKEYEKKRKVPNLSVEEDHVLARCITAFLSQLPDPLIPRTSCDEFINAANRAKSKGDESYVFEAIKQLPVTNRDTLAFLVGHWKKVSAKAEINKMPVEVLAQVLSPSVVGMSRDAAEVNQVARITRQQQKIMEVLLTLGQTYWEQLEYNPGPKPLIFDR